MGMKSYLFLIVVVAAFASCGGNDEQRRQMKDKGLLSTDMVKNPYSGDGLDTSAYNQLPTMDFTDSVHDFGWLTEGAKAIHQFEFKNNGRTPLIISSAAGSCGCAVAEYPKDPVAPGATGVINVEFNSAGKMGHQEKSVSVTTNSKKSVHILYIKADVKPE